MDAAEIQELTRNFESASWAEQIEILKRLHGVEDVQVLEWMYQRLQSDGSLDPAVRAAVIAYFGEMWEYLDQYGGHTDLGATPSTSNVRQSLQKALNDPSATVRLTAAQALQNYDDWLADRNEAPRGISPDHLKEFNEGADAEAELPPSISNPPQVGAPADAPEAAAAAEPVQFSAYSPREIMPNSWQPLRAYVFVASAASAVAADAQAELGARLPDYRQTERPAQTSVAKGALISATPELPGFQFNPPSAQIAFYDDFERFDFKLRPTSAPLDQASNGRITFTVEGVIVADIPLSVYVGASAPVSQPPQTVTRPIYESIFCSYSRQDTQIVERVERAYKALGLTFLRDVETLRSGQDWEKELPRLIEQADIFQLFWSNASAQSAAVREEWTYALSLKRQDEAFIRPVYWQQPMPPPAPELAPINFAYEPDLSQP